jgi:ribosomal protein S12 methylthiotransferase
VGFPGETEAHFEHLCEFVQRHQFDHVGVFTFSPEEGTSAHELPDQLPQEVMDARRDWIMKIQQPISLDHNQQQVGRVVDVLVEQAHPGTGKLIGRSARFAADVDGLVYIHPGSVLPSDSVQLGSLTTVKIEAADEYDLHGYLFNNP